MTLKIATLGPKFSYSYISAKKLFEKDEPYLCKTITEVFSKVYNDDIEFGVVPIENMLNGSVRETLNNLDEYDFKIIKAYNLPIHHCLVSQKDDFRFIKSHPQALAQCSDILKELGKDLVETTSTAKACELAKLDEESAAICSLECAKASNLKILKRNVENNNDNVTKFIVVSKNDFEHDDNGEYTTSLLITPRSERQGILYDILSVFNVKKINLKKIESMPSKLKMGEYKFYFEIDGGLNKTIVKEAIDFLNTMHEVKVLGSYKLN